MTPYRKDLETAQYYIQMEEALKELPQSVLEDLHEIHRELQRIDEAALSGEQIGQVFNALATERGAGGDMTKLAAKVGPALQGTMDKIMNSKAAGILQKVGNAVPIEKLGNFVKKLPEPAGSKASAILATIQSGAQQIENDEDIAAFKGLMLTVITMGMGAAGVGGPAILSVISSAAVFRTVVNAAIKAAAGGTVKDIAKGGAVDLAKAAAAALAGMAINNLGEFIKGSPEDAAAAADKAVEAGKASQQEIAQQPPGYESQYTATGYKLPPGVELSEYNDAISQYENPIEISGGTYDLDGIKKAFTDEFSASGDKLEAMEAAKRWAEQQPGAQVTPFGQLGDQLGLLIQGGIQSGEGAFGDLAAVVAPAAAESVMHPEWTAALSEEIGAEFDELVESVGPEVAVFATLTWYNSWVKENQPIIEGMEYLQKYQLVENVEHAITEAPSFGDISKKVGGAYRQATGKVGGAAGGAAKAVAGAAKKAGSAVKQATGGIGGVLGKMLMPIMKTAPVKAFTNKIQRITGTQGPIDVEKLSAAHASQGSPTDTDDLSKFLSQEAGATKGEIDAAYKAAGVQAEAPPEQPEEEPQAGEQPAQPQAGEQPAQQGAAQGSTQSSTQGSAQGTTSGAAGQQRGGAIGKGVQQAQASDAESEIKDGTTKKVNNVNFKWSAQQGEWLDPNGAPATGLMKQELMKQVGKDITGQTSKPGMLQRAKDYLGGKTAGLAQTTRSDPKASLLKKAGAVGAAAVGGAIGRAIGGSGSKGAQPSQAQAAQSEPSQAQSGKKTLPRTTQSEYTALQKRTMAGDANAAKELIDRLSKASAQNYDINNYANSIGAVLKRSNINDTLKSRLTQKARALRTEAYDHMNNVLESAGLSWQDLGYTVLISESTQDFVLLLPLQEVELEKMKNLAGI